MTNKTALTIIVSVILTVILISLVNVGTSIIIDRPEYNDYCNEFPQKFPSEVVTEEDKTTANEEFNQCNENYREAQKPYNQYKYYIFAGIGFILLLVGLFAKENLIQLTGLAAGGILVAEGVVINAQNEIIVFFSLLAILIVFGVVAWRVIKKYS